MWLAIDVGNTNIVLGLYRNGVVSQRWRISTYPIGTVDEFLAKLTIFLGKVSVKESDLESVLVSSVVPQVTTLLKGAFPAPRCRVIDHTWPFRFKIAAEPASQVGTDRLVNAEAAVREYGAPCLIVDSGTATTLCAVSKNSEYLGGAIMPGIEGSMETLAKRAAKLSSVEIVKPPQVIGRNTPHAIQSGILYGYASMIDGMILKFKKELSDSNVRVVATGGVAQLLNGITEHIDIFDMDLTLKGIGYLYEPIRT